MTSQYVLRRTKAVHSVAFFRLTFEPARRSCVDYSRYGARIAESARMAKQALGDVHILMLRDLPEPANTELKSTFRIHDGREPAKATALVNEIGENVRGIVAGFAGVPTELMERLPNLEIVTYRNAGVDKIDLAYVKSRGIIITHTSPALADDVADLALGLMLAVARQIVVADRYVRQGRWEGGEPRPKFTTVSGKTVGLLGLGHIGSAVAKRTAAMGMNVLYTTRHRVNDVPYEHVPNVKDLAQRSDFLVIAVPGSSQTHHLVDRSVLDALGPNGYVVNVGRGTTIDEAAMIDALRDGTLGGAGLDVFDKEPHVPQALWEFDNVVLSPHNASQATETLAAMGRVALENLVEHFSGRPVISPLALP